MPRLLSVLLVCVAVLAAPTYTVKQLMDFLKSSIERKYPDKEVAQYVSHMKLSEKLDAATIETIQGDGGLGPKTVAALKEMISSSAALTAPVVVAPAPAPTPIPPPPYEEQQDVIRDMTDYALGYTKRLPDFICTQVTRRYADPRKHESWITQDTVVAKVSYLEGHENYEVKLVNNTMVEHKTLDQLSGSVSTGEFGSMMSEIFEPQSGAEFHFDHWGTLRGELVYVFTYQIEQGRSKYSIEYEHKDRVVTAYQGKIYVDKKNHKIQRLTAEAVNIPVAFPVRQASTVLDYKMAQIGTREFLLPMTAEMHIGDDQVAFKNVIEFRAYRRFGADTNIRYDDIPDAVDPAKNKEEAPK